MTKSVPRNRSRNSSMITAFSSRVPKTRFLLPRIKKTLALTKAYLLPLRRDHAAFYLSGRA